MGSLTYANAGEAIAIDDRLLAHIRTVAVTKLRRGESFALTIRTENEANETLWIHSAIPLRFDLQEDVALDRDLLIAMMAAASSSRGLDLTDGRLVEPLTGESRAHALIA